MVVLRKVKNGMVKINHKKYKPSDDYDGRFEGRKVAFGVYPPDVKFVCLWGSEEMFLAKTEEESDKAWDNNWTCINGVFEWSCWREVKPL